MSTEVTACTGGNDNICCYFNICLGGSGVEGREGEGKGVSWQGALTVAMYILTQVCIIIVELSHFSDSSVMNYTPACLSEFFDRATGMGTEMTVSYFGLSCASWCTLGGEGMWVTG